MITKDLANLATAIRGRLQQCVTAHRPLQLTTCLLASLALVRPAALGQPITHLAGSVSFVNSELAKQAVSSHLVTNFDHTLLAGTQFQAELYYLDTDAGTFIPIPATLSSFRSTTTSVFRGAWQGPLQLTSLPGGYGGVDVVDDGFGDVIEAGDGSGTGPGYYPVTLRVVVWDSTTGTNWETASAAGESAPFTYTQRWTPIPIDTQMLRQPGFQVGAPSVPATITTQPTNQSAYWGKDVTLSVGAYGSHWLSYQWFKDGAPLDGANQAAFTWTNLPTSAGGDYWVVVSNSFGGVTSNPAHLLLNAAGLALGLFPGITIDGVVGNTYGIEYTTNLTHTSSWISLTNLTLTAPVQTWIDDSPAAMGGTAPKRNYRVLVP